MPVLLLTFAGLLSQGAVELGPGVERLVSWGVAEFAPYARLYDTPETARSDEMRCLRWVNLSPVSSVMRGFP